MGAQPLSAQLLCSLIDETDGAFRRIVFKYTQSSKLLESAPSSIASLAVLMWVATHHKDFEWKSKGDLMFNLSFFDCLVQVTNEGCSAFVLADNNFTEIQMLAEGMLDKIRDLLENLSEADMRNGILESLFTSVTSCADHAKMVSEKFTSVMYLIDQISVQLSAPKLDDYTAAHQEIKVALHDGMMQLNLVKNDWAEITNSFVQLAAYMRTDFMDDASVNNPDQQKNIAKKIFKMCTTAVRVSALAVAYKDVSSNHLENKVRELSELLTDSRNNNERFSELSRHLWSCMDYIKRIIDESRESLLTRVMEEVDALKRIL